MEKHDLTPEEAEAAVLRRSRRRNVWALHKALAEANAAIGDLWRLDPTLVLDGVLVLHLGTYQFPPRLAYIPKRGRYARLRKGGSADAGE